MSNITLKEWTDALRSGKYQQGKNFLRRTDNTYCCLGVLCDLVDSSKWEVSSTDEDGEVPVYEYPNNYNGFSPLIGDTQMLPTQIAEQFGVHSEVQDILARHNDSGASFSEIADMIDGGLENIEPPVDTLL